MRKAIATGTAALLLTGALFSPARAGDSPGCPYSLGLGRELAYGGTGAAFLGLAWLAGRNARPLTDAEIVSATPDEVNWFDRSATRNWSERSGWWSDRFRDGSVALPFLLLIDEAPRRDMFILAVLYLEVQLINNGLTGFVKVAARRKRPYVYNRDVPIEDKRDPDAARSFYSGHTSAAFSSAVFFATVFSDYYPGSRWIVPVWSASLALASATGYMRYRAGMHFPTDVLAGAVMGGLSGYLVPALHRRGAGNVSIVPLMEDGSGGGLAVILAF